MARNGFNWENRLKFQTLRKSISTPHFQQRLLFTATTLTFLFQVWGKYVKVLKVCFFFEFCKFLTGTIFIEYLKLNNSNVFVIDWSPLVKEPCYFAAVRNSPNVGKCIAQFVNYLRVMNADSIHLIGFSLGAHVAAFAANSLKPYQVSRITGKF